MLNMRAFARDLAWRMHHQACFIERGYQDIAADLRDIASLDIAELKSAFAARQIEILSAYGYQQPVEQSKPFAYSDGVAIIPIHGLLVNRMSWSYSFATGYNFIRSQMNAALNDDDVKLIVYDVNSSGGLVSGCSELAAEIFASRDVKSSLAVIDARCYSAAYFLASAATRVVCTPTGGVGNIGCAAVHIERSELLEKEGVKVTLLFEGAEKVDGNPYEPLSKRARESIQRELSYHYGLFVEAVARHRGLTEEEIRSTGAKCYVPPEAVEVGLIDGVKTPIEAVDEFWNELTQDSETEVDFIMSEKPNTTTAPVAPPAAAAAAPSFSAEDIQRMVSEGVAQAISADRARSAAIRGCDEAKGREKLADHLALNTAMSADEAKAILSAAPKEAPQQNSGRQQPDNYFFAAMNATENPNVGADPDAGATGPGGAPSDPMATANRLLSNFSRATGRKILQGTA